MLMDLKNVWKTYVMGQTEVHALRGINVHIKEKDFVAILGPSGSGKSTAMNIIGCLDTPTKGTVFLEGKDVSKMTEDQLALVRGRTIGFVFQKFNLMPTLTALQNVALPMIFQHETETNRNQRAKELLEKVGLGERIHHKPTELSGGQQQRVAIARALVNNPRIILADEPTGNLDSKTGHQIVEQLKMLNKEGRTIVMVTHEPQLARHAKQVIHMKDGKIKR